MSRGLQPVLALFYCQNVPGSNKEDRRALETQYGQLVRFFPLPCSGRLEPVHLLRALEEFADAAYVLTCPEGTCRYFEGNRRARKRLERTRWVLSGIGLEPERVGVIIGSKDSPKPLAELVDQVLRKISKLGVSPVQRHARFAGEVKV